MIKKHNTSIYFEKSISLFDIHFTTKSNIIDVLYKKGALKVFFLNQAFSQYDHYPEEYNKNFDFDVLFIGSAEQKRYESMCYLAENGININVFGNAWGTAKYPSVKNLVIHRKPLIEEKYRQAISSSKINLCFLRKMNDDLQTARSIEIPGCKGFMIAERTDEHIKLFKEDIEAVYFSNNKELLEKVIFYLDNENLRKEIQANGFKKVIKFRYHYDDMVNRIISHC